MFIRTWKAGITKRENPKTNQVCTTNTNVQVLTQSIYSSHKINVEQHTRFPQHFKNLGFKKHVKQS